VFLKNAFTKPPGWMRAGEGRGKKRKLCAVHLLEKFFFFRPSPTKVFKDLKNTLPLSSKAPAKRGTSYF
jgi:hypothetical protein